MKKYLIIIILILVIYNCKKDEVQNKAMACFTYLPDTSTFVRDTIKFQNCSKNSTNYIWDFGDGITSLDNEPVHVYSDSGIYNIKLTSAEVNSIDSITKTIQINYKYDFRDKYVGKYSCKLIVRMTLPDTSETSEYNNVIIEISKSKDSSILINNAINTDYVDKDYFSGINTILKFFENDSIYIFRGPRALEINEYFGKKIINAR